MMSFVRARVNMVPDVYPIIARQLSRPQTIRFPTETISIALACCTLPLLLG